MPEPGTTRKLVAIVSADVAGYSRLMAADEAGTLAALKAHRAEHWDPKIAEYRGRIVGTAGDSLLVEFTSVVDAVACAVDVQQAMAAGNAELPDDRKMLFRVGVNLGEIIVDDDDIFGDGVNVAARLQEIAEPGGVSVADAVYRQIEGKVDFAFADQGEHRLKNIARPVRVWRWHGDLPGAPATSTVRADTLALPEKPSIAVLPFDNMSGDPEQDYFSDGITEDIITDLSKISGLFVIARNSAFAYKGKVGDVQRVSRELGVRYVLEGSVRKAGGRVRISAQLVDGRTGGHLWAERYDRDLTDIFAVQDEVTEEIVSTLSLKLTAAERGRGPTQDTDNLEAYDYLLRGRGQLLSATKQGNAEARRMFEKARALDPAYASAHARLAQAHTQEMMQGWSESPAESLDRAYAFSEQALALDDSSPLVHGVLAYVCLWRREHARAVAEAERAIALDPNNADSYTALASILTFAGEPEKSLPLMERAMRLNPHYLGEYMAALGHAHFVMRRYEDAVAAFKRGIVRNPDFMPNHLLLAASYAKLGKQAEAQAEVAESKRLSPRISGWMAAAMLPYRRPGDLDHVRDALQWAGLAD